MERVRQRAAPFGRGASRAIHTLIVEDNITVRDIIRSRLEDIGCEVVAEAESAFEGLNLFRRLRPDLVTLDLLMPQVGGIDTKILFRSIREESPEVAIIMISARPKAVERSAYLAEGAIGYFEKPFIDAQTLIATLKRSFPHIDMRAQKHSTRRF